MKEFYWSKIIEKAYSYRILREIVLDWRKGYGEKYIFNKYLGNLAAYSTEEIKGFYQQKSELGYRVCSVYDSEYFPALKEIEIPPIAFYYIGSEKMFHGEKYAGVVGRRKALGKNLKKASALGKGLSKQGIIGVSGLALGIDGAFHQGCSHSIGIIGCGINVIYPRSNLQLYEKLKASGGIISEFPIDAPPLKYHFPRRNRLIAGISQILIVLEARIKSGALITLDYALEYGKEVFLPSSLLTEDFVEGYSIQRLKELFF